MHFICTCQTRVFSEMENSDSIEIVPEEPAGATSKTRSKSRTQSDTRTSKSRSDVNAVVVQQVSSIRASLAEQERHIAASNEKFSKLSDMMTNMSSKFEQLLAQPQPALPDQVYLSDSEDSEPEKPVGDPFEGLFADEIVGPSEPEDMWASLLSSTEAPSEYGTALPLDIAASMQRVTITEPNEEKVKAWKSRYLIPENAKLLASPRVNPEIWAVLDSSHRTQDQQYQNCQSMLSFSLVAQARALAKIGEWRQLKTDVPIAEILKHIGQVLMDSVSCTGVAQWNLSMKRRSLIQLAVPSLKTVSLARSHPAEYLFGDKVHEEIKTAKAAQALMRPNMERKRRPNSGYFGQYSGGYSRQFRDKRARPQPTLNYRGDSQGQGSSGSRKQPPQLPKKNQ